MEDDKKPEQDLEWEPVQLGQHLKFALDKLVEAHEAAVNEMIARYKKTG
jgi:hypothetical protein